MPTDAHSYPSVAAQGATTHGAARGFSGGGESRSHRPRSPPRPGLTTGPSGDDADGTLAHAPLVWVARGRFQSDRPAPTSFEAVSDGNASANLLADARRRRTARASMGPR